MTPIAGNYRQVVMGDHGFGGKIQDLSFGSSLEPVEDEGPKDAMILVLFFIVYKSNLSNMGKSPPSK